MNFLNKNLHQIIKNNLYFLFLKKYKLMLLGKKLYKCLLIQLVFYIIF